ncbi:MAG: competence protein CoiA family protein [Thermoguttaceae bacterium]
MQFALVNGVRSTARPKMTGMCQFCGDKMIAKCGSRTARHWAHSPKRKCDPWWENETLPSWRRYATH